MLKTYKILKIHNFVSQLAMWRVVSGESMSSHGLTSHIHQSQLATWRLVAQSCAFLYVLSITFCNTSPKKKKIFLDYINFLTRVIVLLPVHLYQILWFISHCFQGKNATILLITSMGSFGCCHFLIIIESNSRIWWMMKDWGVWVLLNSFGGFCFDEMIWLSNLLTGIWGLVS